MSITNDVIGKIDCAIKDVDSTISDKINTAKKDIYKDIEKCSKENNEKITEEIRKVNSKIKNMKNYNKKIHKERTIQHQKEMHNMRININYLERLCAYFLIASIVLFLFLVGFSIAYFSMKNNYQSLSNKYLTLSDKYKKLDSKYELMAIEVDNLIKEFTPTNDTTEYYSTEINLTDITAKSNLSADQLNNIIDIQLSDIGHPVTRMSNIGDILVKMENEYQVNAIFCLAVASLESGHGTSFAANNRNNLFGLMGNNGLMKFDSIEKCIMYWGELIRNNYINSGLHTVEQIQHKYCPNSNIWTSNINSFIKTYSNHVKS